MSKQVQTQTTLTACPGCGYGIHLKGEIALGRQVTCLSCDAQLQIIETAPVKLAWIYEEWDIDDDDW